MVARSNFVYDVRVGHTTLKSFKEGQLFYAHKYIHDLKIGSALSFADKRELRIVKRYTSGGFNERT